MAKRTITKRTQVLGVNALARECNVPQSTVSQWMRRGMTADQVRVKAAQAQGRPLPKAKANSKKTEEPSEYDLVVKGRERIDALEDAKLRRAKALAERQELENMLRRGELLPVSYVRQWASRFLIDGRDEMLRMGSELGDTLAAESDPVKCRAILRAAMERALAKFEQLNTIWQGSLDTEQVA